MVQALLNDAFEQVDSEPAILSDPAAEVKGSGCSDQSMRSSVPAPKR